MDIILKVSVVLLFFGLGIYRSRFLWEDAKAFYGIKCRQLSAKKTIAYENTVSIVQYSIGLIVIASFILSPLFLPSLLVGLVIFINGLLLARQARITLGKSWAHILEVTVEKQPLVKTGPYRWCRNPIYVAFFIEWVGFVTTFSWNLLVQPYFWLILIASAWFLIRQYHAAVLLEEKVLTKRYGSDYKSYAATTPRYLPLGPFFKKIHIKPIL